VLPYRSQEGRVAATTRGLGVFLGRELAHVGLGDGDFATSAGTIFAMAPWFLTARPAVNDGDTLSGPDGEQPLRARLHKSSDGRPDTLELVVQG
jgi:hypothetical protein